MRTFDFHSDPGTLQVAGDFDVFDSAIGTTPHYHFDQGQTIFFDFNWTQSGLLVDPAQGFTWGTWDLNLYLERIGPDDPTDPAPAPPDVPFVAGNPYTYDPPRYQLDTTNINPGTFRVTATVCLMRPNGAHYPCSGFAEGPVIYIHHK